jgi:hypothetical protein
MIEYIVHADFESVSLAQEWTAWLLRGHLDAVVAGGALSASLLQISQVQFEARYRFESKEAFAKYESGAAVALRAEGAKLFPPGRGLVMSRSVVDVLS